MDFPDIEALGGGEFLEKLQDCYAQYGRDETIVITRSNRRANRYNEGIRRNVLCAEEEIESGDMLMVVKNNYYYPEHTENCPMNFIANGDIARLKRLRRFEEFYGFRFATAVLEFPDYDDAELECKILLDTIASESPSLTREESTRLFYEVEKDLPGDPRKPPFQCRAGEVLLCRDVPQGAGRAVARSLRRPLPVRRRAHDTRPSPLALYGPDARHGQTLSCKFRRRFL